MYGRKWICNVRIKGGEIWTRLSKKKGDNSVVVGFLDKSIMWT